MMIKIFYIFFSIFCCLIEIIFSHFFTLYLFLFLSLALFAQIECWFGWKKVSSKTTFSMEFDWIAVKMNSLRLFMVHYRSIFCILKMLNWMHCVDQHREHIQCQMDIFVCLYERTQVNTPFFPLHIHWKYYCFFRHRNVNNNNWTLNVFEENFRGNKK